MSDELKNPALADLQFLVGTWEMTLFGAPFLPDPDETLTGFVEFDPIEAGTLLVMRQVPDPSGPPLASWVIGRDASRPVYTVLYTDDRVVSRVYDMTIAGEEWKIWRDDSDFSQRFGATISADRHSIAGRWEKRSSGADWEHDFNVTYSRVHRQR